MSNEVVYDESVKIRDFALENGQKSSVSPFKGQLLYDIDSNKVCYGKYNTKTQEVEWADLNTAVTPIKYAELKALRDSGQLVPNMRYRITDYVTTTTQEHTSSAGHTFDIVVTANTPSELSENAQARIHGDTGGGGGDEEDGYHFIIDGYSEVEVAYKVFVDEYTSETFGDYFNPSVVPAGLSYDDNGIPIIYFNDNEFPAGWVDEYSDYMKYNGRYTYDGVEYDSWVQYNSGGCGDYSEQDGYDAGKSVDWNRVHILTNIIVANGSPSGGDDEEDDDEHRVTIKYKMFVDGDVLEDMYERPGGGRHNEIDFAMYSEAGEPQIYLNGEDHIGAIGGADYLYYQGRYTYNGKEYDKWLLYNSHNTDDENNYTYYYDGIGFTGGQTVMLTNIVTDGNGHFADWVEVRNDVYPMDIRLIIPQFKIYIDESSEVTEYDNGGGEVAKIFKEMDFTGYKNGTPVIYVNEPWHKGCTDYADYLLYDGVYEYNGTEYDKWVQYHCDDSGNYTTIGASVWDETTQDSIPAIVVLLTNRVITDDGKFRGDVTNAVFEIIDDVDTMLFVDIDESGDADGYNDGHLPAEIYSLVLGDDGRPRLYVNDSEYLGEQDTDYYIYMGRYDYNGTEYDSWAKYSPSDHCYYIRGMRLLTNIVIETTYVEPTPAGTKFDSWVLCDENGDEIHENIRLLTNKVIGINMATPVGDDPTYSIIDNDVELKYMVHTDDDSLYANGVRLAFGNMNIVYKMVIDDDSLNIRSPYGHNPTNLTLDGWDWLNGELIVYINDADYHGVLDENTDYMKYNGRYTYDGVEYDSWIKYDTNHTYNLNEYNTIIHFDEDTARIMLLTNIVVGRPLEMMEVYSFALDNDGIPRLYLNKEEHIGEPNTDYWRYAGEYWYDDEGDDEPDDQSHTGTKFDSWVCYTSDDEPLYISFDNGGGNLRVLTNVVVSSTGGDNPTYAITDDNIELKYRILDDSDALYDTFVKPYRFNISSPAEITTMYKLDMDWGDMDWASYFHPSYPRFNSDDEFGYLHDGYPYVKYRDVDYNGTTNTRINYMKYNGTYNYDGVEYDSWIEFRDDGNGGYSSYIEGYGNASMYRRMILTNIVISNNTGDNQAISEIFSAEIDNDGIPRLYLNSEGYIALRDASYFKYAGEYWYDDGSEDEPDEPDEQPSTATEFDSWVCCNPDGSEISSSDGGIRLLTNIVVSSTGGDNPTYTIMDDNVELKYRMRDDNDNDTLYDTFVTPYRLNISSLDEITTMYKLDYDCDSGDISFSYSSPSYPRFNSDGEELGYLPDGFPYVKYRDIDYSSNHHINYMKYNGIYEHNGVEYDSWVEFRDNGDDTYTSYEASQGGSVINRRIILTNIVVSIDIDHRQFSREVFSVEIDNNGIPRLYLNKAGYIGIPDSCYWRYAGRYWYDDGSGDGEDVHDTWFDESNLGAWTLKYSLDNDTDRFAWADTENGKGVIYYMRDEFGNEAPYDFKNILYKRYGLNDASLVAHSYQNMGCMLPYEALEQVGVTENGCDSINAFTFCKNAIGDKCYDASLNVIKTMPYNVRGNVIKPTYDMNGRMCLPDVVFVNATNGNAPVSDMQDSIRMYYVISIDSGEEVYSTPRGIYSYWFFFNQTTNTFERRLYTNRHIDCLCGKDTEYWEYMGKWSQDGRVYDQWKRNPSNSHHPSDVRLLTDEIVLDENDNLPASRDSKVEKRIHRLDNGTYYVGDSGIKFLASGGINIIGATDSYYRRDAIIDRVYFQGNVPSIDARDVHNYSIRYTAIYNGRFVVRRDDGNDHYHLPTEGEYDSWYVRGGDGVLVFTNTAVLDVNALSWFNTVEGNCRHSTFSLLSYGCKCQYGSSLVIAVGDVENREYRGNRDGITGYCRAICTPMLTE